MIRYVHPLYVCPQWWPGPLVRPLPSGYELSKLGGGALYGGHEDTFLHQRLQVTGAAGRSVCMLVHLCSLFSNTVASNSWKSKTVLYILDKQIPCSPCDRFMEVSLQCGVLCEGWRWLCESGAGGVWSYMGQTCSEAAVHQRPGVSRWKPQQEQHHPLQVWQRQSGEGCTLRMIQYICSCWTDIHIIQSEELFNSCMSTSCQYGTQL